MPKKTISFCAIVALIICSVLLGACRDDDQADQPAKPAATPTSQAANSPNKPPTTYYGAIDYRDCDYVKGWVYNSVNPKEDINVALFIDDKLIETIPAKTLRPDVKAQKIGTGLYGYSFKIPANFKDGTAHTVSVKTVGSDYTLLVPQTIYATATCKP